jgi:hypothetical protein
MPWGFRKNGFRRRFIITGALPYSCTAFPNPFSGFLMIQHPEGIDHTFILVGINGTLFPCESQKTDGGTILKTSRLPAGIYLLFNGNLRTGKALKRIKL